VGLTFRNYQCRLAERVVGQATLTEVDKEVLTARTPCLTLTTVDLVLVVVVLDLKVGPVVRQKAALALVMTERLTVVVDLAVTF
jgi:hypothetical protein